MSVSLSVHFACNKMQGKVVCLMGHARGLNTWTLKNVLSYLPPQNPLAAISSLAPSWWLAVAPTRVSPGAHCKPGSMHTSWHTSVSKVALILRISLRILDGNPPFTQDRACFTEKFLSQAHTDGISDGIQPYWIARAS